MKDRRVIRFLAPLTTILQVRRRHVKHWLLPPRLSA